MKRKRINLALQGGSAHGAFAWGVLDGILSCEWLDIDAISGTSAGSVNAVLLAQGFLTGGRGGAKQLLQDFWTKIGAINQQMQSPFDWLSLALTQKTFLYHMSELMLHVFSPYESNPFNYNPVKEILQSLIDFKAINQASAIKLFICATNVKSGKIHIFQQPSLSIEAILASACLPKYFQAVNVEGEYYWDGGYLGNPAIFPLIYQTSTPDILILNLTPIERDTLPRTVDEIDLRLTEISFNSSLMREMRAIAFVTKLIDEGWIKKKYESKLKRVYMHIIQSDDCMQPLPHSTFTLADQALLQKLYAAGCHAFDTWLNKNNDAIGKKTTIDFKAWL